MDSDVLLGSIEEIFLTLLEALERGDTPAITSSWLPPYRLSTSNAVKFGDCFIILNEMHDLLNRNANITIRDIYYKYEERFHNQRRVETAVSQACKMLHCSREESHILACAKGLIVGKLSIELESGSVIDCALSKTGTLVPEQISTISEIRCNADVILIIEKHAIFQKLIDVEFCEFMDSEYGFSVVLCTARGYPDIATRGFLKYLDDRLAIPMMCLTDANPHGLEIMLTYKFGPIKYSPSTYGLCVPSLKWVGLKPSDIEQLVPSSSLSDLTDRDLQKCESLLKRECVVTDWELVEELKIFVARQKKAELESLDSVSSNYLSKTYLPGAMLNPCGFKVV